MLRVNSLKINKNIYEGIAFAFPGGLVGLCCCCGVTPSVCIEQPRLFPQIHWKLTWLSRNLWKLQFYTSAAQLRHTATTSNNMLLKKEVLTSREECEGLTVAFNIAKCFGLTQWGALALSFLRQVFVMLQRYCYFSLFQLKDQNYVTCNFFFCWGVAHSTCSAFAEQVTVVPCSLLVPVLFRGNCSKLQIWGQLWALCVTDLPGGALYLCPFSGSNNSIVPSSGC